MDNHQKTFLTKLCGCCFNNGEDNQGDPDSVQMSALPNSDLQPPASNSKPQPQPSVSMTPKMQAPQADLSTLPADENDGLTEKRKEELKIGIDSIRDSSWEERIALVMRSGIAASTYEKMIDEGFTWQFVNVVFKNPNKIFREIKNISDKNIKTLRNKLAPLSASEKMFFVNAMSEDFYAVHFTNSQVINPKTGEAELYSRKKLQKRSIPFDENNTPEIDLERTASDDFVFFSLESGTKPHKQVSNIGSKKKEVGMRFDFENSVFKTVSWMYLLDFQTECNDWDVEKYIPGILTQDEISALNGKKMEYKQYECMFQGASMKQGLLLSIIELLRDEVDAERRDRIFDAVADGTLNLNNVVNGLFRPQVMVPRHFFGVPEESPNLTKLVKESEA